MSNQHKYQTRAATAAATTAAVAAAAAAAALVVSKNRFKVQDRANVLGGRVVDDDDQGECKLFNCL